MYRFSTADSRKNLGPCLYKERDGDEVEASALQLSGAYTLL
jgi:hypothetical protein